MNFPSKSKRTFTGPKRKRATSSSPKLPSLPRRFLAYQLDTALINALAMKALHVKATSSPQVVFFVYKLIDGSAQLLEWRVLIVVLLVMPLLPALSLALAGCTPGMWVTGLRCAHIADHRQKISVTSALLRCYVVSWSWIFYFMPLIYGLTRPGRRHLGDIIAGTHLVRHKARRTAKELIAPTTLDVKLASVLLAITAILWLGSAARVFLGISPMREGIVLGSNSSKRRAFITDYYKHREINKALRAGRRCAEPEACFEYFKELLRDKNKEMLVLITTPTSQELIERIGKTKYMDQLPSSRIEFAKLERTSDPDKVKIFYQKTHFRPSDMPADDEDVQTPNEYIVFTKDGDLWRIDWIAYFMGIAKIPKRFGP